MKKIELEAKNAKLEACVEALSNTSREKRLEFAKACCRALSALFGFGVGLPAAPFSALAGGVSAA